MMERLDFMLKWGTSLLVLSCFLIILYFRFTLLNFYDPDTGGVEYELIYEIQRLYNGEALYTNPEKAPFHINQKTPLYHLLVNGIAKVFFKEIKDPFVFFQISRYLSFCIVLGSLLLCFFLSRKVLKIDLLVSLLILFGLYNNMTHHFHSRMDTLYLLLFTGILFLFFKHFKAINLKIVFQLGLLSMLLILTKQTGIFIGVPMALVLFFPVSFLSFKRTLLYGLTALGGLGLVCFLGKADYLALYANLILGIQNGVSYHFLSNVLQSEIQLPLLLSGFILPFFLWKFRSDRKAFIPLAIFLGYYLLVGLSSCLKFGAGLNYLIEFKLLLFLTFACLFFRQRIFTLPWHRLGQYLFYFILVITSFGKIKEYRADFKINNYRDALENYEAQKAVATYLQEEADLKQEEFVYIAITWLAEEGFLVNLLAENTILPTISVFDPTWRSNPERLNLETLFDGLNTGLIRFVIINQDQTLSSITCLDHKFTNFQMRTKIGPFAIYEWAQ